MDNRQSNKRAFGPPMARLRHNPSVADKSVAYILNFRDSHHEAFASPKRIKVSISNSHILQRTTDSGQRTTDNGQFRAVIFGTDLKPFIFILLVLILTLSASPLNAAEARGVWLCAWDLNTLSECQTAISKCHAYHYNCIFAQVRSRGDAYYFPNRDDDVYPNPEPRGEQYTISPADFDPLQCLIDNGHSQNPPIEIHAWVVVYPCWNQSSQPDSSQHVYRTHPQWVTENSSGETMPWNGSGGEGAYLDPGIPAVQDYLFNVFMDIVRNYDIDGLHLDYIRYPGTSYGYDPIAKQAFLADTGFNIDTDAGISGTWALWRRTQINRLVKRIYRAAIREKPRLKITSALITHTDPRSGKLQGFDHWARGDKESGGGPYLPYHDILIPMCYSDTLSGTKTKYSRIANYGYGATLYAGPSAYLTGDTPSLIVQKINTMRAYTGSPPRPDGFVFFSFGGMTEDSDARFHATSDPGGPFDADDTVPVPHTKTPDVVPPLSPANVIATTPAPRTVRITFSAPAAASDGDCPVSYRIFRSEASPVPEFYENLIMVFWDVNHTRTHFSWEDVSAQSGQTYYYKVISIDDYDNRAAAPPVNATPTGTTIIIESHPSGLNNTYYAETSGKWYDSSSYSTAAGCTAQKSRYALYDDVGGKNDRSRYDPNLPTAGRYNLYVTTYKWGSADAKNCKITIHHKNGDTVIYRDITASNCGDKWYELGTYEFAAGKGGYVEFDDSTVTSPAGGQHRLTTHGMKWELASGASPTPWERRPPPPEDIPTNQPGEAFYADDSPLMMDYEDANGWDTSSYLPFFGNTKRYATNPTTKATFVVWLPVSGRYSIDGAINSGGYTDSAKYRFIHTGGVVMRTLSQSHITTGWHLDIDEVSAENAYHFSAGYNYVAVWDEANDGKFCIADGIRFTLRVPDRPRRPQGIVLY